MCCIPRTADWRTVAKSAWLALMLTLLLTFPVRAQGNAPDNNTEFDRLSVDEGLSQVTVETILQDPGGSCGSARRMG